MAQVSKESVQVDQMIQVNRLIPIDQEATENATKAEKEVEAFKGHMLKHAGSGALTAELLAHFKSTH